MYMWQPGKNHGVIAQTPSILLFETGSLFGLELNK